MGEYHVDVREAVKYFKGNCVLNNVSLGLPRGTITGLKGHNGSGKTMLLRAIAGLIKLNAGEITVDGKLLGRDISFPPSMGLIIENSVVWNHMTGLESLCLLADIRKKIGKAEVREAIKRVGLDPDDKRKFRKYSLGMKQRLMIAQAIMETPDLLLLDEPTNALDPDGVERVRGIIAAEKQRGATILIVSHLSDDLKTLCDAAYEMINGRLKQT
jgi:ABC-2 type transport system ATP-binding protein